MTTGALWLMAAVGVLALALGAGLLLNGAARRREASRYASRLAGVMVAAVGLILIVFAAAWRFAG